MANRTIKEAVSVKGTNPQYLIEKIIRTRIYDSRYWKEECFALTAELMVDKAMELRYVGGIYGGNIKPTPFLCLVLKMLQIQPEKDIVIEFIKNEDFKYVRALGAFYMRLVGTSMECYKYLEPLLNDYRKLRFQNKNGKFELLHMDEFVDHILREERYCDVILPRIQKRHVMEEANEIEPRVSALDEDLENEDSDESEDEDEKRRSLSPPPAPSISRDRERERDRHREKRDDRGRDRDRERDRKKDYERERDRDRDRDREREREKRRDRDDRDRKRHRSRSKSRDRGDYERSRDRERDRDNRKDREKEKDKNKKNKDRKGKQETSTEEQEIAEANALRAKLGLAPLRR